MEQAVASQWNTVWTAAQNGEVWEYFAAVGEANIANWRAGAKTYDPQQTQDLFRAEHLHLAQSRHFQARLDNLAVARAQAQGIFELTIKTVSELNLQLTKLLAFANGAVVLGTLAFIGNEHSASVQNELIPVVILCSVGFLLTLLASHIALLRSRRIITLLGELTALRLSDAARSERHSEIQRRGRTTAWTVQPLYYISAACLGLAMVFGVSALRTPPDQIAPSISDVLVE